MARQAKNTEATATKEAAQEVKPVVETKAAEKKEATATKGEYPEYVDAILKAHPEMEKAYINSKGFLFTAATPAHMTEGGVLYTNKYFH